MMNQELSGAPAAVPVEDSSWIDDPLDPSSWQAGLQRLSRSIVACAVEEQKLELKQELEQLLLQLFASRSEEMLETGVFFALGWRRFDLIARFWDAVTPQVVARVLPGALWQVFSSYRIRSLDFGLFLSSDKQETLELLELFLARKQLTRGFEKRLAASFLDDEAGTDRAIGAVHELVCLIGVAPEELELSLRAFLENGHRRLAEAIEQGDWPWAITFIRRIDPLRNVIRRIEFSMESLFFQLYRLVPEERRNTVLAFLLRWKYPVALRSLLAEMSSAPQYRLLGSAVVEAAEYTGEQAKGVFCLLDNLSTEEWRAVYQAVCYVSDIDGESALLQETLVGWIESEDCLIRDKGFHTAGLLSHLFQKPVSWLTGLERNYLERIWKRVDSLERPEEWAALLERLHNLMHFTGMRWTEAELFLPVVRNGVCSWHDEVCAAVIRYCRKDPELQQWFSGLISDSFFQMDMTEGLYDPKWSVRVRTLNRLLGIYLRSPVRSLFLLKRLQQFVDIIDEWANGTAAGEMPELPYNPQLYRQLRRAVQRLQQRCAVD